MQEQVKIHRDDVDLAASPLVLGFLKIIGYDRKFVIIEADRLQRRELVRNGIAYAFT